MWKYLIGHQENVDGVNALAVARYYIDTRQDRNRGRYDNILSSTLNPHDATLYDDPYIALLWRDEFFSDGKLYRIWK